MERKNHFRTGVRQCGRQKVADLQTASMLWGSCSLPGHSYTDGESRYCSLDQFIFYPQQASFVIEGACSLAYWSNHSSLAMRGGSSQSAERPQLPSAPLSLSILRTVMRNRLLSMKEGSRLLRPPWRCVVWISPLISLVSSQYEGPYCHDIVIDHWPHSCLSQSPPPDMPMRILGGGERAPIMIMTAAAWADQGGAVEGRGGKDEW